MEIWPRYTRMRSGHCNGYRVKAIQMPARKPVLRGMHWRRRLVKLNGLGGQLKLWRVCEDFQIWECPWDLDMTVWDGMVMSDYD
jgi:hypothetical protein